MRHVVVGVVLLLAGCDGGSKRESRTTATTSERPPATVPSSRPEPPKPWLGQSIPFVAATSVDKVKWLKQAGVHADPILLGPSYRLDETTPYVPSHGDLTDIFAADTSHSFGGFASLRTRQTMDYGMVTPGMIVHVKTDATHDQLFDCHVAAEGWQLEFQTAADWAWSGPALTAVTVTVQSSHAFFVLPKDATHDWAFVRIVATLQNPVDQYWRFVGCDIAPIN